MHMYDIQEKLLLTFDLFLQFTNFYLLRSQKLLHVVFATLTDRSW